MGPALSLGCELRMMAATGNISDMDNSARCRLRGRVTAVVGQPARTQTSDRLPNRPAELAPGKHAFPAAICGKFVASSP